MAGLLCGLQACSSGTRGMSDYERAQLQLLQQQQALREEESIRNHTARLVEASSALLQPTPDYGSDSTQTQCVTGLDPQGLLVTQCSQ